MRSLFLLLITVSLTLSNDFQETIDQFGSQLFSTITLEKGKNLAILPFSSEIDDPQQQLGTAFAEYLITYTNENTDIALVDRSDMQKIIEEQVFTATGMTTDTNTIELGNLSVAHYVVSGKVTMAMNRYYVTAKVVNSETGDILSSAKSSFPTESANSAVTALYEEKNYALTAAFRSFLIPGWGQVYSDEPVHAIVSAVLCATGVTATVITGAKKGDSWSEYKQFTDKVGTQSYWDERDAIAAAQGISLTEAEEVLKAKESELYDTYNDKKKNFGITAAVTGGLWALNVVDAIFMGKRAEKKLQLYFSSNPIDNHYSVQLAYHF